MYRQVFLSSSNSLTTLTGYDACEQASRVDGIEILYRRKAYSTPVSSSNGQDSHRLVTVPRSYLEIVYGMNAIYGLTFFKATQKNARELPDTIIIGVYHEGGVPWNNEIPP